MPSCAFMRCTNHSKRKNKSHGITFHSFPGDELVRHKWLLVVRKQRQEPDWTPNQHSRICSIHFKRDDIYTTNKGYRRLSKTAVPFFQAAMLATSCNYSRPTTPNSLNDVNISDLESVFESPRKTFLKKKLRTMELKKKKLMQSNKNLKKKVNRLTNTCKNLRETVIQLKKKINVTEDQFAELCLKAESVDLFKRLLRHKKGNKNPRLSFSPSLRKFALTLYFYSPTGYKYVRQVFEDALPHPRTLGKWYEKVDAAPGFTAESFEILKKKVLATKTKILCTLVVDEMAIRQQPIWNGKKTEGLVDFGTGSTETDKISSQAFVMMLVSLNENWKLPVAYFFVNGLAAECKANLIRTCLTKCYDVGVTVVALTFDGCRSNFSAANLLGCRLNDINDLKTTFTHPSCDMEVAVFPDPCHMVKLVRNTFESKKIFFDSMGGEVKWRFLVSLLDLQKSETLRFANKLTPRHLHFRNQIMKVKLATQLLSMSVAKSLTLCENMLKSKRFVNTDATVKFIENINNIFDVMNSRKRNKFGFQKPICPENKDTIFNFLDETKQYISGLKYFVKYRRIAKKKVTMKILKKNLVNTTRKTGFIGFIICAESLKHLYNALVETKLLQYIATYRLSQDHIELFFGLIRRQGGYNNNPNTKQFRGIYRKTLGHLELRSSFSGNCIPLDNFPLLTCTSAIECINQTMEKNIDDEIDEGTISISDLSKQSQIFKKYSVTKFKSRVRVQIIKKNKVLQSDSVVDSNVDILSNLLNDKYKHKLSSCAEQIVGYVAGWVARALITTIKCETCVSELITTQKLFFHQLISIKDMGGLCYPSYDTFLICAKSENVLRKMYISQGNHITCEKEFLKLKLIILKDFLDSDVFSQLLAHSKDHPVILNHRTHLLRAIIDKYCNVRLHYAHKIDPALSTVTQRQKRNKLSLFEGK